MSERFSVTRRVESFGFAIRGIALVLRTQHNAWIHAVATVAVIALSLWLELPARDWLWIVAAIVAVWAAEAFNTAIERLSDAVTTESNPLIGQAKDAAAGAVLIAAVGAAMIGVLVIGPRLLAKF